MLHRQPFLRGAKVALDAGDNARPSGWQHDQLLLTWSVRERPWEIESHVIRELEPPLNSAGDAAHSFHARAHRARAEFRRRAVMRAR